MKKTYWAEVCKDEGNPNLGIVFPDFPGCVSCGETMEEVLWMAQEALQGHIRCMEQDNEEIPEPSDYENAVKKSEDDAWMFIPVTVEVQSPKRIKINISLPEDILYKVDSQAKNLNMSRSALIAQTLQKTIR
jgi:predicted RNase H-like HicB family nuclease